jgi:hypothetical protein
MEQVLVWISVGKNWNVSHVELNIKSIGLETDTRSTTDEQTWPSRKALYFKKRLVSTNMGFM